MADETAAPTSTTSSPTPQPRRLLGRQAQIAIAIAAVVIVLLLISWLAGNARVNRAGDQAAEVASSLAAFALGEPLRVGHQPTLRRLAVQMAEASKAKSITIADPSGRVLASTDRTLEGTTVEELASLPAEPRSIRRGNSRFGVSAVNHLGRIVGGVRVEIAR